MAAIDFAASVAAVELSDSLMLGQAFLDSGRESDSIHLDFTSTLPSRLRFVPSVVIRKRSGWEKAIGQSLEIFDVAHVEDLQSEGFDGLQGLVRIVSDI